MVLVLAYFAMYGIINIWNPVSPWQLKVIISNHGTIIKSV